MTTGFRIADAIHLGAMVFIRQEYSILSIFIVAVFLLLALVTDWVSAGAYVFGAASSAAAAFIGMATATRANVRTAIEARDRGAQGALR